MTANSYEERRCPPGAPYSIHRGDKGGDINHGNPISHCPSCRKDRTIGIPTNEIDGIDLI